MEQTLEERLASQLGQLKAEADKAKEDQADDPARAEYWEGYLDGLWLAIEVLEDYEDWKGVI